MVKIDGILKDLGNLYSLTGGQERFQIWYRLAGISGEGEESQNEIALYLTENEAGMDSSIKHLSTADHMVGEFFYELENADLRGHDFLNNGSLTVLGQEWRERTERAINKLYSSDAVDFTEDDQKPEGVLYPENLRSIGEIYSVLGQPNNLTYLELLDRDSSRSEYQEHLDLEEYLRSGENLEHNGFIEISDSGESEITELGEEVYNEIVKGSDGDYAWVKEFLEWYSF